MQMRECQRYHFNAQILCTCSNKCNQVDSTEPFEWSNRREQRNHCNRDCIFSIFQWRVRLEWVSERVGEFQRDFFFHSISPESGRHLFILHFRMQLKFRWHWGTIQHRLHWMFSQVWLFRWQSARSVQSPAFVSLTLYAWDCCKSSGKHRIRK